MRLTPSRLVRCLFMIGLLAGSALGVSAKAVRPQRPAALTTAVSTLTFAPNADAHVRSGSPDQNYGTSSRLEVDGSPWIESNLRFVVTGVSGSIQSAVLRLYATNGSSDGPEIYATTSEWTETGLTWRNRPARTSTAVDDQGTISAKSWVEFNITPLVSGDGTYSFRVSPTSNDGVELNAREAGSNRPQLVLKVESSAATTPTSTPVSGAVTTPTSTPVSGAVTTPTSTPVSSAATPGASGTDPILVGAGDIAGDNSGDDATSKLLDTIPGTVFTVGDNVYEDGTDAQFAAYYDPTWGRHKARTRPAVGNHEYHVAGAAGYFKYFGAAAGDPTKGYYSYDLGTWHVVVLNSNCSPVGGCGLGSAQEKWLRADLAAHPTACTVAYMHHPRFSSGSHGSNTSVQPFWQALYDAGVEVVVAGHDHLYERFAPQDPTGKADPTRGIRSFVVGTGGRGLYAFGTPLPNSEVRNNTAYGVLQLTLRAGSYDWKFVPVAGKTFTDTGTATCNGTS